MGSGRELSSCTAATRNGITMVHGLPACKAGYGSMPPVPYQGEDGYKECALNKGKIHDGWICHECQGGVCMSLFAFAGSQGTMI